MAIQDDFTIDTVDKKITYTTAFVDDRPPDIYTLNEFYSWLMDWIDEPANMDEQQPISAQTPTQYTMLYPWFIDNESLKALYGGSLQTSGWAFSAVPQTGITALRWSGGADPPTAGDIGVDLSGVTSTADGTIIAVDVDRQICWVRNTNGTQFQGGESVTGTGVTLTTETINGFESGNNIWANLYSVGSLQTGTEIYIGQEDDQLGGAAFHTASEYQRRIEKIPEWWDSDVNFYSGSPNLLGGAGHFDVLVLVQEMGNLIDTGRLAVYARQFSKVYSHFELVGGVGNFVVPFASTGADLNSATGPYNIGFDAGTGGKAQLDAGDILENHTGTTPVGRLRAVVTAVNGTTSGDFDFYLIGENEADGTLDQLLDNENMIVRGNAFNFDIDGTGTALTTQAPGTAQGITITFATASADINEDTTVEQYACTIDCNNVALSEVYKRTQYLTARGNQNATVAGTPDVLLPSAHSTKDEDSEFFRAIGDILFEFDGGIGTRITEGDYVVGATSLATGIVTSVVAATTGKCVLTQVKGTFQENELVSRPGESGTNAIVINEPTTGPVSLVDNTAAPFGTFAGGRWFVAQGILLTNVPAADANDWQTVDLDGNVISPPAVRSITFGGLEIGDRAAVFEVTAAGGIGIKKDQNGVASGGALSDTTFVLDTTIALDVPPTGWVRIVDDSDSANGTEFRYEYSGISTTTVTLRTGAGLTGTTTSAGSSTLLNDTGAFSSFGTDGNVKVGHEIRNTIGGGIATVIRKVSDDQIETTPLSTGTWTSGIAWEANQIVVALAAADTCYFGYIDDVVVSGDNLNNTFKYPGHDTNVIARARFSSPNGGQRILPYEQKSITLEDADKVITAVRTDDTIAS